ncbi:MAG: hypothetical protein EA385_01370 [Salinarimonadaceae bacterium]|nr:MAG: hypothetical protein EA385_01370 [Salinarimonadaceae bacterium]
MTDNVEDRDHAVEAPRRTNQVGSVVKAIKILNYMSTLDGAEGVVNIARACKINQSTCFNILRTLAGFDFVHANSETRKYELGHGLAPIASRAMQRWTSANAVRNLVAEFTNKFELSVSLWRRLGPDRLILAFAEESGSSVRIRMHLGQRIPLMGGAMGRLFATQAQIPSAAVESQFIAVRWQRPIDFETFMAEAEKARQQGWSVDDGRYTRGNLTIATLVPVRENLGQIACAATMSQGQHDEAVQAEIGRELVRLCYRIAQLLNINSKELIDAN